MRRIRALLLTGSAVLVVGCPGPQGSSVPVNTGDTTPPVLFALETLGRQGGELSVSQSSGPISGTIAANESMQVAARGDDPEGVRQVAIWGTTEKTCIDQNGIGTKTGPGLAGAPLADSTDTATSGGTTTNQRVATYAVKTSDYACPSGSKVSLNLVFWATTENFGGGSDQSDTLTLTYSQP